MPRDARPAVPESMVQYLVARWLDAHAVLWFHCPNEGLRSPRTGSRLKSHGMKAGVPDVLIMTPPPAHPDKVGVAIELKATNGKLTDAQSRWLVDLRKLGWLTGVCYGAEDALAWLQTLGYVES